jgi:hypothetical protein
MLCCGILALSAAALAGWRLLRALPRIFLALVGALLVAGSVAPLSTGAASDGAMMRADAWAWAKLSLCGNDDEARSTGTIAGVFR